MKFVGRRFILFVLVPIMIGLLIFGVVVFRQIKSTRANLDRKTGIEISPSATNIVEELFNALK